MISRRRWKKLKNFSLIIINRNISCSNSGFSLLKGSFGICSIGFSLNGLLFCFINSKILSSLSCNWFGKPKALSKSLLLYSNCSSKFSAWTTLRPGLGSIISVIISSFFHTHFQPLCLNEVYSLSLQVVTSLFLLHRIFY